MNPQPYIARISIAYPDIIQYCFIVSSTVQYCPVLFNIVQVVILALSCPSCHVFNSYIIKHCLVLTRITQNSPILPILSSCASFTCFQWAKAHSRTQSEKVLKFYSINIVKLFCLNSLMLLEIDNILLKIVRYLLILLYIVYYCRKSINIVQYCHIFSNIVNNFQTLFGIVKWYP